MLADFSKLGVSVQVMDSGHWNGLSGYLDEAPTKTTSATLPPSVTYMSLLQSLERLSTAFWECDFIRNTALGLEIGFLSEFDGCVDTAEMILFSLGVHIICILF